MRPYQDQWELLRSIEKNKIEILDSIISDNNLNNEVAKKETFSDANSSNNYGLPICAQKMLKNGVYFDQRIACFRLALNLKRIGLPLDICIGTLLNWRQKNNPINGKRIITADEVKEQTRWAYSKDYKGYGCDEPIIKSFCNSKCPLYKYLKQKNND